MRPNAGERKKFCMSIITRADLEGDIVMGVFGVWIVILGSLDEFEGEVGWVRSKPDWEEWSQKFEAVPIMALRWGIVGSVEDIVLVLILG